MKTSQILLTDPNNLTCWNSFRAARKPEKGYPFCYFGASQASEAGGGQLGLQGEEELGVVLPIKKGRYSVKIWGKKITLTQED